MCLAPSQFAFNPSSIFYIMTCRKPLNDASQFVAQRYRAYQEPAILRVMSAKASFHLKWDSAREPALEFVADSLQVVRMDQPGPNVSGFNLWQSKAVVFQQHLIHIQNVSIRRQNENLLRNG